MHVLIYEKRPLKFSDENNTFHFEFYNSAVSSSWIACVERQIDWYVIHADADRVGLDVVVGIATSYSWAVRELNPNVCAIFRTRPDRLWSPPCLLYNVYRVIRRVQGPNWCWPPTTFSVEVKERVELYPCSPSVLSWQDKKWNLLFYIGIYYFQNFRKRSNFCNVCLNF